MEELTRVRNEMGWSQQKLADESGVNKATINQIERGRRSPNIETLQKLANAMGREIGDFFPKAQAPLWSDNPPAERRAYRFADAIRAAARKWAEEVSVPGMSNDRRFGLLDAGFDLARSIEETVEAESWDAIPNEERKAIISTLEELNETATRGNQYLEDEIRKREVQHRREKIRKWTNQLSA